MTSAFDLTAQLNKPVLKEGSKGDAVKELQGLLLKYGAYVTVGSTGACVFPGEEVIDGNFGRKTTAAVKLFQARMFLLEDGIVGDKTWRSLFKGAPVSLPTLQRGSKGDLVKRVQQRLNIGGYDAGAVDGDFGNRSEKAVRQLQKNTGLPVDGVVGERTWFEISKISTIFC
jgi:peptidoglycan hydrolase-like protein with peptidoglycan-binding domain